MKIVDTQIFSAGTFADSDEFNEILEEIEVAIKSITWFHDEKFIINPVRLGNGVKPIKLSFVSTLENFGWTTEKSFVLIDKLNAGPIDAIKKTSRGFFAVEWETGNVSSSHRALNKIALAVDQDHIIGGILVVPNKKLSKYLTDRIGNYEEIEPYFELFKKYNLKGILGIISVEFDDVDEASPLIPKGKDGHAKKAKKKKAAQKTKKVVIKKTAEKKLKQIVL